jgi:SAM-dependent methyltransferase
VAHEVAVNFYDRWVLPPILDLVMRQTQLEKYRREVVAAARGRVLEVGVGSGLNFPLYGKQIETVIGIDPSPRLLAIARRRVAAGARGIGGVCDAPACGRTIEPCDDLGAVRSDPLSRHADAGFSPGRLLFVEHGFPVGMSAQHRLTPFTLPWLSPGSKMDDLIRSAGLRSD